MENQNKNEQNKKEKTQKENFILQLIKLVTSETLNRYSRGWFNQPMSPASGKVRATYVSVPSLAFQLSEIDLFRLCRTLV